ncbi:MAG: PilZ domain-containing protein, partial [Gemmataceae bacterium]|nr:PilZ domain-containing protein [Gemmataceae bacterium]
MADHDTQWDTTRRFPRLLPRGATRLEAYGDPVAQGPDLALAVLDLSASGARLRLAQPFAPGHLLGVALYGPHLAPIAGAARVVWCQDADDGTYLAGVSFDHEAGEDNVAALA